MLDLATEWTFTWPLFGAYAEIRHPFARRVRFAPRQRGGRRDVLARARSVCLSAPLAGACKMLLTGFCNQRSTRVPALRSTSERRAETLPTARPSRPKPGERRGARPPCGDPAPVGGALDGAPPASVESRTCPACAGRRHRRSGATSTRRCRPRARLSTRLLTPAVTRAALGLTRWPRAPRSGRDRLPSRSHAAPVPGRLPSMGALGGAIAFAIVSPGARHRSRGLATATRLPTLVRLLDALASGS